jgi:RNA recognition motif-containing protein
MPNDAEAQKAIEELNGRSLKDREITVTEAKPKSEDGGGFNRNNNSNRGGGGGYNRDRY